MKKPKVIGVLLAFGALVASGITFSGNFNSKNTNYIREGVVDENHYREAIYDTGVKPSKLQIMDYSDYTQQPSGDNLYNTQKNYHLNSLNLGDTWDTYRGDGVTVAVIDTGINYSHNDFVYYNTSGTSISDLSADFEDPNATGTATKKTVATYGWSVMTDANGHGTNVASTIASRINGTGCVGVAPNVNLMFLKCPNLMSSEVSAAIRYAADNGADIITMSLGMYTYSFTSSQTGETVAYSSNAASLFSSAINYAHGKNCLILAAAGNDNTDALSYPACNNYVIGVGALASQSRTTKAGYSNYNPSGNTSSSNNNVDVTVCGSVYVAGKDSNTHYKSTQGTSFSCPITAAALALYCQAHSDWTISSAEEALFNTCDDIGDSGWDSTFGYGCVDINELVTISYNFSGVSLDKNTLELYANDDSSTVTATVVPNYATNKTINWTNSDSTVATISSAISTSGSGITVTGKKAGTTTLTARSAEDSSKYATCTVTVESYTSSAFTMDSSASIVVGDTYQISVNWTNGTPTYTDLSYSSSDTGVCTVSSTGLITAKAAGTATITVDSMDEQHTMAVTVVAEAPGDYVLVTDASTLSSGDKILLVNASDSKANGSLYSPGSSTYLTAEDVTISNSRISTLPSGVAPITLGGSSGAWTLTINGSTTLYADGSNFYSTSGSGRSSTYTLSISNSVATLKASGASNPIKYNSSSPRFKPYSGLNDIQIYKKESGSSGGTNYTVTFNSNGGTGTMTSQTTSGSSYTTPSCTFTYTGYTFSKWALNSAGGTQYNAGQTITNISANITLYAIWTQNGSVTEIDDDYGNYYSSITTQTGSDLQTALNNLNNDHRTTISYANMRYKFQYVDLDWTNTTNMYGFYDNTVLSKTWDSGATWNREHVWPQSLGGDQVENDMHMVRPASVSTNSGRGNKYYASSVFDPGTYDANYRGIAARIIFYCAIADTDLSIIDANSGGSNQMGKLSDLLQWNLNYLPDRKSSAPLSLRVEQYRNMILYSGNDLQGNRNPFIDHPEYACKIWGNTNDTTRQICGINGSLTLSESSKSLTVDQNFTLTATASGGTGSVLWSSSDENVCTLSTTSGNSVTITGVGAGSATITASYGSLTATCTVTVTGSGSTPTVNSVSVSPKTMTLNISSGSASGTITPTVNVSGGAATTVDWNVSPSGQGVTVSGGTVTAAANATTGTYTVTATSTVDNTKSDYCTVTVTDSGNSNTTNVDLDNGTFSDGKITWRTEDDHCTVEQMQTGGNAVSSDYISNPRVYKSNTLCFTADYGYKIASISLKYNGTYSGKNMTAGTTLSNSTVVDDSTTVARNWDTNSGGTHTVSSVSSQGLQTIYIQNVAGTGNNNVQFRPTQITISYVEQSVTPTPTLSSISINTENVNKSFSVGDPFSYTGLVVTGHYSDSSTSTISSGYTVSSPDMSSAGTKTITVSYGDFDATYTITVSNVSVTGVTLNKNSTSITVGSTETLTATVAPSNATNKNVTWTSSATSVASVSGGTVTALATGSTTITVRTVDGGYTATCTVTVTAAPTITYQLEADSSEVPFNSGTNHVASVGVKLYQYNNGVKGSVVSSGNVNVDTSSLGTKTVQYTYSSTTYTTMVKVTNHGTTYSEPTPTSSSSTFNLSNDTGKKFSTSTTTVQGWTVNLGGTTNVEASGSGTSGYNKFGSGKSSFSSLVFSYSLSSDAQINSVSIKCCRSGTDLSTNLVAYTLDSNSNKVYLSCSGGSLTIPTGTSVSSMQTFTFTPATNTTHTGTIYIGVEGSSGGKQLYVNSLSCSYTTYEGADNDFTLLEQAQAWARYFVQETRTAEACLASLDSQKLVGLQAKWADLAYEYVNMVGGAKDEFCTSSDATIVEARSHYLFIVSKFGASNLGTDGAFVKNSSNQVLQAKQYNPLTLLSSNSSIPIAVIISVVSVSSIGLYFYFKKRKEED